MANFSAKCSIMTQEMVDSFCESFYIPAEVHPTAPGRDKTIAQFPADMGLSDFIKTAGPRKVRAVEVQKGDDQIPAPIEGGQEDVAEENAYLELADPDEGTAMARQSEEEVVTERPKKIKKKRLIRQSDVLPAKKLRTDHPSIASGTGGGHPSRIFRRCSAMCRGTPVISVGFQAKTSRFCLSKAHSSLRPFSVRVYLMLLFARGPEIIAHSIGIALLLRIVTVPPFIGNFNIPCTMDEVELCLSNYLH
ncbi:hypothetical protein Tco_0693525 [Tanacetum coccineum]